MQIHFLSMRFLPKYSYKAILKNINHKPRVTNLYNLNWTSDFQIYNLFVTVFLSSKNPMSLPFNGKNLKISLIPEDRFFSVRWIIYTGWDHSLWQNHIMIHSSNLLVCQYMTSAYMTKLFEPSEKKSTNISFLFASDFLNL